MTHALYAASPHDETVPIAPGDRSNFVELPPYVQYRMSLVGMAIASKRRDFIAAAPSTIKDELAPIKIGRQADIQSCLGVIAVSH